MSRLYLIIFAIGFITLSYHCQCQVGFNLDGVLGIKFRESKENVKAILSKKEGMVYYTKNEKPNMISFTGGKFAGRDIVLLSVGFYKNMAHTIKIFINCPEKNKCIDKYKEIKEEINQKYFTSSSDYENYEYPYEKGDGHVETAISVGKASFFTYWKFDNNNSISLEIEKEFMISITYQDAVLIKEYIEEKKKENSKDY